MSWLSNPDARPPAPVTLRFIPQILSNPGSLARYALDGTVVDRSVAAWLATR